MSKQNNSKKSKNKQQKKHKRLGCFLNISLVIAFVYACYLTIEVYFPIEDYELIKEYSEANDLDEALVCAIINVESGFNPNAVSNKGASGYMQVMEQTANWGIETMNLTGVSYDDILDPELNIAIGTWYLRVLLNQFHSEELAIISYNAGSGNVSKWLQEYGNEDETLKNIPYKETKNYYYKVMMNKFVYNLLLIGYGYM